MRDYDPTTGRYLQADPLGLVDGASVYGYALQNPGRWVDPRGEAVTVICRLLAGLAGATQARHCAVFVVQYDCTCSGNAQFSLAGGDSTFNGGSQSSRVVFDVDRRAFQDRRNPYGDVSSYPVSPPNGMSDCEFEFRLIQEGMNYRQGPYSAIFGPNSNTAVRSLVTRSGGAVRNFERAPAQYSNSRKRFSMATRRRLITSIFLLAILGAGLIAPHVVRRTIVQGQFKGFTIGASKIQVFHVLQEKENISSVSARVPEFRVDHENLEDLSHLYRFPAFMIQSPSTQLRVYHDHGRINYLNRSGVGWQMEGGWNYLDEIIPMIGDFLTRNQDASLIAIPEGRAYSNETSISIGKFMPQVTRENQNWLFQYDEWFFKEDDRRTHFNLFFERGKLIRVEFRNYLVEFP